MPLKEYTLGRGRVRFARYKPGTQVPDGFHYFGNTPEFNLSIESEQLDHYSSEGGIREKDDQMTLEVMRSASLITDNISPDNVAFFFFGESLNVTQTAEVGLSETIEDVKVGKSYKIGSTDENPIGVMGLENFTATGLTLGEDFTVDLDTGLITLLEDAPNVSDGDDLALTYDLKASTRSRVISGGSRIEGALMYITDNPKGPDSVFYMPYVSISPNGDFALKGDEWQQIPLQIEVLKPTGQEAIYRDGKPAYT